MSAPDSRALAAGLPFRTRKVKHVKLTAEQWALLEREADLRMRTTRNKTLAHKIGTTELYVAQVICRLLKERRGLVPRLAHVFAAADDEERV